MDTNFTGGLSWSLFLLIFYVFITKKDTTGLWSEKYMSYMLEKNIYYTLEVIFHNILSHQEGTLNFLEVSYLSDLISYLYVGGKFMFPSLNSLYSKY